MHEKSGYLKRVLGVALAVGFILPAGADAASFSIFDLTDTVTVSDVNSTSRLFGVNCGGGEGCFFAIGFIQGTATFQVTYNNTVFPAIAAINMLEPGTGRVSDALQQTDSSTQATFWQFVSDSEIPLPGINGAPTLLEDGTVQPTLVITYRNSDRTVIGSDVINIQSDVEAPEPAALPLTLAGLAILGIGRLLRRAAFGAYSDRNAGRFRN